MGDKKRATVIYINKGGDEVEVNDTPGNHTAAQDAGWKLKKK